MNTNTLKILLLVFAGSALCSNAQVLNKQKTLQKFDFWDNRDFEWYENNIPFFESPDHELDLTYYYRWELVTKHLVYGSPQSGYALTEFIDRPWWSGAYGAISCSSAHQFYEMRWLKDSRFFEDYAKYWFFTQNAQPRTYSNWNADAIWQSYKVFYDKSFILGLLPSLIDNYKGWEKEHYIAQEGMFSWDGMHDGMETNINSRQTKDWFAGAPGYRPTLNSYMWADAQAIKEISLLNGDKSKASEFLKKAETIKFNFQTKCWDPERNFFINRYQKDEDGGIKANTLTYQTGKFVGNKHGREEIGFIPWYFNMVDPGFEKAWSYLMDTAYFFADYGPFTVEKNDPMFQIARNCCVWSGNSWPFATTQTLKGMANLLKNYKQDFVDKKDYYKLLSVYSSTHRKDGKPYIAEACHPITGSWSGNDVPYHSEHYFHSGYVDLIISDLIGLEPHNSDSVTVNPLIPESWDYFCLEDVTYHGNLLTIIWDRDGKKYNKGAGLQILLNNKVIAKSAKIKKITAYVPNNVSPNKVNKYNLAVNNGQGYFPRAITSFPGVTFPFTYLNDGQYWYHIFPPNRWSSLGSKENGMQWCGIDFGNEKEIEEVKVYFIDDSLLIKKPVSYALEYWDGKAWQKVRSTSIYPKQPQGRMANTITLPKLKTSKLRITMEPQKGFAVGLSEFETWSSILDDNQNFTSKVENIAIYSKAKITASYTSRSPEFDIAYLNDGIIKPSELWSAHRSKNKADTVTVHLESIKSIHTAYLFFYEDVWEQKPPKSYEIQYLDETSKNWINVKNHQKTPEIPIGRSLNLATFDKIKTSKLRVIMQHLKSGNYTAMYELELFGNN